MGGTKGTSVWILSKPPERDRKAKRIRPFCFFLFVDGLECGCCTLSTSELHKHYLEPPAPELFPIHKNKRKLAGKKLLVAANA